MPGTAGLPRLRAASWLLIEDGDTLTVTHFAVPFDVDAVVGDLRQRRHPNAEFITSILTGPAVTAAGQRPQPTIAAAGVGPYGKGRRQ